MKIPSMQRLSMEHDPLRNDCDNISYQLRSILQCVIPSCLAFFSLSSIFLVFVILNFQPIFFLLQFLLLRIFQIKIIDCASLSYDCKIELDKIEKNQLKIISKLIFFAIGHETNAMFSAQSNR